MMVPPDVLTGTAVDVSAPVSEEDEDEEMPPLIRIDEVLLVCENPRFSIDSARVDVSSNLQDFSDGGLKYGIQAIAISALRPADASLPYLTPFYERCWSGALAMM